MKKKYSKPYIFIESFQLDASIATSCSAENKYPIHFGVQTCSAGNEEGETYVDVLGNACTINVSDNKGGDDNDTFCYHGSINPYDLFINS